VFRPHYRAPDPARALKNSNAERHILPRGGTNPTSL
jgi:hypothetical protein